MDALNITLESLSDNQREIAELIGLDNYIKLARYYGGAVPYITRFDKLMKSSRNERIIQDSKVLSVKELSQKYGLGPRQIHNIIPRNMKHRTRRNKTGEHLDES